MANQKIPSRLKNVPKTLLIPLRARYLETQTPNGIINDPKSVEMLERIDYDFSGENEVSKGSQVGISIRTEILDELTRRFLSDQQDAVVVNLGCGLDTRFHRLDNASVRWFDLDVPEVIALRKHFFKETERHRFISKSAFEFSWMRQIPPHTPLLLIAEGLLMYFTASKVKLLLKTIGENFPHAEMLLEAMSPFVVKRTAKHPDIKKFDATFKWGVKTGKEIESWDIGVKFIDEYFYFDRHKNKHTLVYRLLAVLPGFRKMMKIIHIRFQ